MRRGLFHALALTVLAALLAVVGWLWRGRPWRVVASVNGHSLTSGELGMRTKTLMNDARRAASPGAPADGDEEEFDRCRRQAVRMWIVKEVMLAEALVRGYTVDSADEKEALAQVSSRLKSRGMTIDEFFREGPLPEELKRRDFQEGVLINKLAGKEIRDQIQVSAKEVEERLADIGKRTPAKAVPSRRQVLDQLRSERFRGRFRELFRELLRKVEVKCIDYPALESVDGISPTLPAQGKELQ